MTTIFVAVWWASFERDECKLAACSYSLSSITCYFSKPNDVLVLFVACIYQTKKKVKWKWINTTTIWITSSSTQFLKINLTILLITIWSHMSAAFWGLSLISHFLLSQRFTPQSIQSILSIIDYLFWLILTCFFFQEIL